MKTTNITESRKLQDIRAWIKIVEQEKKEGIRGFVLKVLNRMAMPNKIFTTTEKWIDLLTFEEMQEIERIEMGARLNEKI